jgi:tight adherence protein C
MILYVIPLLTALTLLTAAAAVYQLRLRSHRAAERLHQLVDGTHEQALNDGFVDVSVPMMLRPVTFLGWLMPGHMASDTLRWELARAGIRHPRARMVFAGLRVLSTASLALASALVAWHFRLRPTEVLVCAAVSGAAGFYLPVMVLRFLQSRRQEEITLSLPDALDLLVICVEAGQGLNSALLKVSRECEFHARALSDELRVATNEMLAGVTRTQALRNLAMRTGVDDVRALVAVMIQSDRFGTSIAHALRVHAASLRTRRRQRAEENARKAPVKLVFPLVFCIFPELLVVILAPGMLQLYHALAAMS